jgi:hypothetical protein
MKVFFDTEFTGLHQNTTLISIGCVSDDGKTFYGECTDYDRKQVDKWIEENVLSRLFLDDEGADNETIDGHYRVCGKSGVVAYWLRDWLQAMSTKDAVYGDARNLFPDRYPQTIEMWSDVLAYDWVLFCELYGTFNIPECVYYIPFDLATLLKMKGIDPDIDREGYAGIEYTGDKKHSALHDAQVIKACYEKAMG